MPRSSPVVLLIGRVPVEPWVSGALFLDQGFSGISSLGIRGLTRGSVDNTSSFFIGVEERPTILSSVLNLCRLAHW
jgi:hypothetical protein